MTRTQKAIKYFAIVLAFFLIFNIVIALISAFLFIGNFFGFINNDKYITETNEQISEKVNKINELHIDINYSKLEIKESQEFKVLTNNQKIKYTYKNNNIYIKESDKDFNFSSRKQSEIVIGLPKNTKFKLVKIDSGAGKIKLENISTENFDIEIGAGEVKINNLKVTNQTELEGGAGSLTVSNANINDADIDLGTGKFEFTGTMSGINKIDSGIGETNIDLLDELENYTIKASKGLGKININGKEQNTYGTGKTKITIDGGIGSININ